MRTWKSGIVRARESGGPGRGFHSRMRRDPGDERGNGFFPGQFPPQPKPCPATALSVAPEWPGHEVMSWRPRCRRSSYSCRCRVSWWRRPGRERRCRAGIAPAPAGASLPGRSRDPGPWRQRPGRGAFADASNAVIPCPCNTGRRNAPPLPEGQAVAQAGHGRTAPRERTGTPARQRAPADPAIKMSRSCPGERNRIDGPAIPAGTLWSAAPPGDAFPHGLIFHHLNILIFLQK